MASQKQTRVKSDYMAGLWKGNLIFDLMWTRTDHPGCPSRAPIYRAPSQSWVSLDDQVSDPWGLHSGGAQHIRCNDVFGQVISGFIHIRRKLYNERIKQQNFLVGYRSEYSECQMHYFRDSDNDDSQGEDNTQREDYCPGEKYYILTLTYEETFNGRGTAKGLALQPTGAKVG